MTTATAPPRLITAAEFLEMEPPPGKRYELIRGFLKEKEVTAGHPHGDTVSHCHGILYYHIVIVAGYGSLSTGEPGYRLERDPDTVRAPDIAWIAPGRIPPGTTGYPELTPDLCIEVASPSNARADRLLSDKAQMWVDSGAREVWVLNPEDTTLTRYRPGRPPVTLDADDILDGGDLLPGFSIAIWRLFRLQR